jgi:hypothetical protein
MTEPELRDLMNEMGRRIVTAATNRDVEKPQFVLLLFNDPAVAQYMANCVREDVIKALRETADRLEQNQVVMRE